MSTATAGPRGSPGTFAAPAGRDPMQDTITAVVRRASDHAPRSRQRASGPSSMGQPCARRVAYEAFGTERVNTHTDPWPAIVGTAVHTWLAEAFRADNTRLRRLRWLVEQRVHLTDGISGTADLFDLDTATVIDHKVLGAATLRELRTDGPSPVYRTQLHLYGYGYTRAGVRVDRVAIAAYPRSGWLDGLHVWSEPYDPAVAEAALDRHAGLVSLGFVLDVETQPQRWALIPAAGGPGCTWCPFWRGGTTPADATGCPGT